MKDYKRTILVICFLSILGNCVTVDFEPDDIYPKLAREADISKKNNAKYRVKLAMSRSDSATPAASFFILEKKDFEKVFIDDANSPITVRLKQELEFELWQMVLLFQPLPIPVKINMEYNVAIQQNKPVKYTIERSAYLNLFLTVLIVPIITAIYSGEDAKAEVIEFKKNLVFHLHSEVAKIAPSNLAVYPDFPAFADFTDTVVLKNGEFIENVKAKVTPTTLEVTDPSGKTTIYKKSQVLSVKKK